MFFRACVFVSLFLFSSPVSAELQILLGLDRVTPEMVKKLEEKMRSLLDWVINTTGYEHPEKLPPLVLCGPEEGCKDNSVIRINTSGQLAYPFQLLHKDTPRENAILLHELVHWVHVWRNGSLPDKASSDSACEWMLESEQEAYNLQAKYLKEKTGKQMQIPRLSCRNGIVFVNWMSQQTE